MHNGRFPDQWKEFGDLCRSEPFRWFCSSPLPSDEQRLICTACGHGESYAGVEPPYAGGPRAPHHTACGVMHAQELRVMTDPEQHHEAHGAPPWEAPYVWETNYLDGV